MALKRKSPGRPQREDMTYVGIFKVNKVGEDY